MKKIGIIGGGISGLTLGCVIKGSGKECVIFERSSALSEHGAGISLTPNACKILDEIDILDAVRAESCSPLDIAWRDDQGNVIKKVNICCIHTFQTCIHELLLIHPQQKTSGINQPFHIHANMCSIKLYPVSKFSIKKYSSTVFPFFNMSVQIESAFSVLPIVRDFL